MIKPVKPQILIQDAWSRHLKLLRYKRVQSTNKIAYRLGGKGADEWTVVVADVQTEGKGRRGKRWESPKGGLWFSILLRPKIPSGILALLQFFAANKARQSINDETGADVQLKWPNDLVLGARKLGGILIESRMLGEKVLYAVVGIGLNVNQAEKTLPPGATSLLMETGRRFERLRLLKGIVHQMSSRYDKVDQPSGIVEEFWNNCIHRDRMVEISLPEGKVAGIARGVDPSGALILEDGEKRIRKIVEGTLRVVN